MNIRFYNPGPAFNEQMAFDHPTNDPKRMNLISYWPIAAGAESFFDVPTFTEVPTDQGPVQIAVKFADRVQKDFRDFGVVRVDPSRNPATIADFENVACSEKEAKIKGKTMWEGHLVQLARDHIESVERARNLGAIPARASGRRKHALTVLGIQDPADSAGNLAQSNRDVASINDLMAKMAELQRELVALKGKA